MDEKVLKEFDTLRNDYRKKMLEQVYKLESTWQCFKHTKTDGLNEFYLIVHNLSGTAGTYGYPCVSQLCRALVLYIDDCHRDGIELCTQTVSHRIETLIILSCLESCTPLFDKEEMQIYLSRDWTRETPGRERVAPSL